MSRYTLQECRCCHGAVYWLEHHRAPEYNSIRCTYCRDNCYRQKRHVPRLHEVAS